MSTTTTTTTRDRGDRYGPMEWAQQVPRDLGAHISIEESGEMRRVGRWWASECTNCTADGIITVDTGADRPVA